MPWQEIHINADGSYQTCGDQIKDFLHENAFRETYNVRNMTPEAWMRCQFQTQARLDKLNGVANPACAMCYTEEAAGKSSKRLREIEKFKVIPAAFKQSDLVYEPISYHLSLGNECNLACKMCNPLASSRIASELKQQCQYTGPVIENWTNDDALWNRTIDSMLANKNFKFLHIIGGEPLINRRLEPLLDQLIAAGKTDLKYVGFTTNATVYNQQIMEKLAQFRYVDVGVSIETADRLNDFIRKGSDTKTILANTEQFLQHRRPGRLAITIRTVPSALSVPSIDSLMQWCADRCADVMSNTLVSPEYMQMRHLPQDVKRRLIDRLNRWPYSEPAPEGAHSRDERYYKAHIDAELRAILRQLELPNDAAKTEQLYDQLGRWGWLDDAEIRQHFVLE